MLFSCVELLKYINGGLDCKQYPLIAMPPLQNRNFEVKENATVGGQYLHVRHRSALVFFMRVL